MTTLPAKTIALVTSPAALVIVMLSSTALAEEATVDAASNEQPSRAEDGPESSELPAQAASESEPEVALGSAPVEPTPPGESPSEPAVVQPEEYAASFRLHLAPSERDQRRARSLSIAGWVMFGVGLAATVAGAVFLSDPEHHARALGGMVGGSGLAVAIPGLVMGLVGRARMRRISSAHQSEDSSYDAVRESFTELVPQIQQCYEGNSSSPADASISIRIAPDGEPTFLQADPPVPSTVDGCLRQIITNATFPPLLSGRVFSFTPSIPSSE